MKRLIFSFFFLVVGMGVGGGGLYVGLNWDQLNPFKKPSGDSMQTLLAQLRRACATEDALKGATVKSARIADGKLTLAGVVAKAEQKALLEARGKAILAEDPELAKQCEAGVSTDGLTVFAIQEHLTQLQRDFDEGRGAEAPTDALRREIMRATRLDGLSIADDGKLLVTGVSVRGNTKTHTADDALHAAVKNRLEAAGVPASAVPEIVLKVQHFPNPAALLQKKLDKDDQAKDVRLASAWFDGAGKLHIEGIVAKEGQRKLVEDAAAALMKEPASQAMTKGTSNYTVRLVTYAAEARSIELQKKWIEHARKENKPALHRVRIENIQAATFVTDDEGNANYAFRVKGRLFETANDRKAIETELAAWLKEQLPKVLNQNQTLIAPQLDLDARPSPVFALQERVVQRGLDGAVFTDARFDEKGRLELLGRLHQAGVEGTQTLEAAVTDLLAGESPWTLENLKFHESTKEGQAIGWKDVEKQIQTKLAQNTPLSQRARLDRLYYAYDKSQLLLAGEGVFLADSADENPTGALSKAVDDVLASRGQAAVSTAAFKRHNNPLAVLQNLTGERTDLDGVLLTGLRYGPEGMLQVHGYFGLPGHKAILTPILAAKLEKIPDAVRKGSWSLAAMKLHPSTQGEWKWNEVVLACQADLAAAPKAVDRRACLERAYFKYAEGKVRRLALHCKGTYLAKPQEVVSTDALTQKIEGACKRLLSEVRIDQVYADLTQLATPIYDLQKQAAELRYDGLLFTEAFYDRDGKLAFTGLRGNAEQLNQARELVDRLKDKKALAPAGVAPLDRLKLVAWQPLLDELKTQFAADASALFRQTRIDRGYYSYDAKHNPVLNFQGICIYQGKVPTPDEQYPALANRLKKQLASKGLDGFEIRLAGVERKPNPHVLLQEKANQNELNGVAFNAIGFDAKGGCYVRLPFVPTGQAEPIRKLLDDFAKQYPHLGPIQQR